MAPRNEHLSQDWQFQPGAGAGGSKDSLDAHRLILAMASPVFAAMFYGDVGDKEGPVIISDIDRPTFSALLEYIYTDEVNLSNTKIAANLYGAANKYILIHLEKQCLDYLLQKLNANNVCHIYEFACLYSENELKEKCLELISTKTPAVLKGPSFRSIQTETLKHIVSMESLNIESEMELFHAVLDYFDNGNDDDTKMIRDDNQKLAVNSCEAVNQQPKNDANFSSTPTESIANKRKLARRNIPGVIEQIRFLTMTPAELAENEEISTLLTNDEMLALLANSASTKVAIPMPDGFSISREKRNTLFCRNATRPEINSPSLFNITYELNNRSEATYQWLVSDFKSTESARFSPPFYVRGLQWSIVIQPEQEPGQRKMLGIFLKCYGPRNYSWWICRATVELRIISHYDPNTKKYFKYLKNHTNKANTWGSIEFEEWREVRNPRNGYIKDDTLITEVHIIAYTPIYDDEDSDN